MQNAAQTLRDKIPQEELERLVRIASNVAREHWCDEAISEIHECRLQSAATYLQEAYRYGRQGSLPLEFYEVRHALNLV